MLDDVASRAVAGLVPPPRLRLSDWIEANLRLPQGVSSMPGKVKLWPHQIGIADAISDPRIVRVSVIKSARIGYTSLLTGALGSFVANDPSSILVLLPTEDDARDYVVSDVEPIFANSPLLAGTLADDTEEGERNTLMSRRFPGGSIKFLAAKATRNLRRHNARVLFIDETDAMEMTREGPPVMLAENRVRTFNDRKIVSGSTPTDTETSAILRAYEASDKRVFEVPCPRCGVCFEISWRHIRWPEGRPDQAGCECPGCATLIPETAKRAMVSQGAWRITAPEVKEHAGFRLNSLISLLSNASWGTLAQEFVAAAKDPEALRVFANTVLGEGWHGEGDEIDETKVAARVENWGIDVPAEGQHTIPDDVLFVTAGVDIQDDRAEISFIGWSRGDIFVLGHEIIWGGPTDNATWVRLDDVLKTTWKHHGGVLRIVGAAIDSGYATDQVYRFCGPRISRRIFAVKGIAGSRPHIAHTKTVINHCRLFLVGVDTAKATLLARIDAGQGIRFSHSLGLDYFEQLCSEKRVIRYRHGQPYKRFERIAGRRSEALDCLVYGFAVRDLLGVRFDQLEAEFAVDRTAPPPQPPPLKPPQPQSSIRYTFTMASRARPVG
jgi:phage terminase large subunit GpA-like protein